MAKELRKISFTLSDLHGIVSTYAEKSGLPKPPAEFTAIKALPGARIELLSEDTKPVVFEEKQMIVAILLYCRIAEIPIPKDAKKVVKTEGNSLSLMFQVS